MGRSTWERNLRRMAPLGRPARSSVSIFASGTEYSTASNSEQTPEVSTTSPTTTVSSSMTVWSASDMFDATRGRVGPELDPTHQNGYLGPSRYRISSLSVPRMKNVSGSIVFS